jgi:hypothetical protein
MNASANCEQRKRERERTETCSRESRQSADLLCFFSLQVAVCIQRTYDKFRKSKFIDSICWAILIFSSSMALLKYIFSLPLCIHFFY